MEKKEIKISLTTFIVGIIAIVLLVLCVGMGIYISTMNKNQTNNPNTVSIQNKTSTIDESKAEELDVNSELVQKLYSYVNDSEGNYVSTNAVICGLNSIMYTSGKSTVNTLSNDTKLLTVIEIMLQTKEYTEIKASSFPKYYYDNDYEFEYYNVNIDSESYWYNYETKKWELEDGRNIITIDDVKVFDMNTIQKISKEIFDEELEIEKHSYEFSGIDLAYDTEGYKLVLFQGGGGPAAIFGNKIIKAEKEENNIYIYDNYIAGFDKYIEDEKGISKAVPELYVALDKKKQIKSSNSNKEIDLMDLMSEKDDETYELDPKKAEEYGITLPIYKHTFTKSESGNYYWVSTELTNY